MVIHDALRRVRGRPEHTLPQFEVGHTPSPRCRRCWHQAPLQQRARARLLVMYSTPNISVETSRSTRYATMLAPLHTHPPGGQAPGLQHMLMPMRCMH